MISKKVFRGGSWFNSARSCRSAYRLRDQPGGRDYLLGFRVLKQKSNTENNQ